MVGFCEHKLRSLRRNAARLAKLTGCKRLLSPRICRTYRDIPSRIRLSIASLLKISAFRKPRSLPTILAGSFSSSRLYLSAQSFQIKHPQATGRAVCKLPNWFHPCIAASTVGESAMRSSSPSSASKPDAIRRQVRPMALRTFSRAAASRSRTDRQPAINRTSTAPRISIPITSSSFLRQKAPQAGIKHASATALRKHMP